MFCDKCGSLLPDRAKFCPECGMPVDQTRPRTDRREIRTVQFRCKSCGNVMEIDPDSPILRCSACGSNELIQEDRDVTVERIRSRAKREEQQAYREVQKGWQKVRQKEIEVDNKATEYARTKAEMHSYMEGSLYTLTIILLFLSALGLGIAFLYQSTVAAIVAVLQIILALISMLMGLQTIKERGRGLRTALVILSAVLIFPYFSFCSSEDARREERERMEELATKEMAWPTVGLAQMLPVPDTDYGEISDNDDSVFICTLYAYTEDQFNTYIQNCKNGGFAVDAEKGSYSFSAYDADGYYLVLKYTSYSDELEITLKAPLFGDPNFVWPESAIANVVPVFDNKKGFVDTNTEETLKLTMCEITQEEYAAYISKCEQAGFTIDAEKKEKTFTAFNAEGYKLTVSLEAMSTAAITADAPRKMTAVTWPAVGPATMLPTPEVTVGSINSNYDWTFSVYLGNYPIDAFNAYVDKCLSSGFDDDYSRSDTYFSADKGKNIDLTVKYVGYNTIYISITDHDKF